MSDQEPVYSKEEVKAATEKAATEASGNTMFGCLIVVILLAVAGWFAWTQGWIFGIGTGSWESIYKEKLPAVVKVNHFDHKGELVGFGSGFFVSKDGVLVTNAHVVGGAALLNVEVPGADKPIRVKVLARNEKADVAVLKLETAVDLKYFDLDESVPVTGTSIAAIGHPQGFANTLSTGEVSGYRDAKELGEDNGTKWIQITVPISSGSSGGPVFNDKGKVIGMATAFWQEGQNLNFAAPAHAIRSVLNAVTKSQAEPQVDPAPKGDSKPTVQLPQIPYKPYTPPKHGYPKYPYLDPKVLEQLRTLSPYWEKDTTGKYGIPRYEKK